jgi:acyl-CoA synthetase (AMP-forming)/AMP-acid ligase II
VAHWRTALALSSSDRMQIMTPPSHILGLLNIATALDVGAWIRLHPRFDVDTMLRHIESDRITVEMAVAPIALALAAHPRLEDYDLSSLRYVMWCATPVTQSVADRVTSRVGVNWVTAYGASELPVITCNALQDARLDTVGRAVPGVRIRIADIATGAPVPVGDDGEIQVLSPTAMAGYLPDDATADAFDDGWYRTGDVGHLDADGWLRITDRTKEMIKVRGFQVAPAEIEAVLHGHSAVADCAVFGVPDAASGEAIVAAVSRCGAVESDELIELVADRLASYKRPSRVAFVEEIPRLPSGKVLRRVLRERVMIGAKNRGL